MSPDLESLEDRFQLVQKYYEEAKTHDEKVQLAIIAKKIAQEYRRQIVEFKRIGNASNSYQNSERQTRSIRRSKKRAGRKMPSL